MSASATAAPAYPDPGRREPLFRSAAYAARQRAAGRLLKSALIASSFLSVGNYSEAIVPANLAIVAQVASIVMWTLIIGASYFVPRRIAMGAWTDLALGIAFYGYAIVSVLWSDLLPTSFLKSAALLVTTFAAYRLALSLTIDEIVDCAIVGLGIQCAASVFVVLVFPDIGIIRTWMHEGQWSGIFESKQSLGAVGALLTFFSGYRFLTRRQWLPFAVTVTVAVACVVGSGSRGAGATAIAAIAFLYLVRRSRGLGRILAFGPVAMTIVACVLLAHLYVTDNPYFLLYGERVDITSRTMIWHHALERFDANPVLGFGLNGFWSVDTILHAFLREHGWVLDNFHSGYLAILIETGLVGMALYLAWFLMFGIRMATQIGREAVPSPHLHLIIAYMNLMFFFNVTETFFLRSTNFMAVMMAALFFASTQVVVRAQAFTSANALTRREEV